MNKILVGLILCAACTGFAKEKGSIGFSGKVGVDGFFSPEISSFEIEEVFADSPAEKAGLKAGDKVLAIEDCQIPGCDTDEAQELMKRAPGEELRLTIQTKDGEEKEILILVGEPIEES
ncbi:PDZ domain-containing protein [Kangiella aquimarina]|uniref:PDZ domain-containing protein n=1 Tax=Kangiella aquimarina TaxID=261965 RepID=A0ABZ0X571_9GAMM|nr:PDZ domain-containing protein [Kangiella aquimarina]WQG85747.1 PDZ domain-containing protein [Kangiella aquimarina]